MNVRKLHRSFYRREPIDVARDLLGQTLVHVVNGQRLAGRIVETEAYLGVEDKACHAYGGRRTARTETMYLDGGTSYVYLNYGIHHLFNVVVSKAEVPEAVLVRALEPTEGLASMYERRSAAKADSDLCSGPGKLGAALGLDRRHNALDLVNGDALFIERTRSRRDALHIVECPRIGVDYAEEWALAPLRFYVDGNINVSRKSVE